MKSEILFYSGNGNHPLGAQIIQQLGEYMGTELEFSHINFDRFPDGESDTKIPKFSNVKGKMVVFYQSIENEALFLETLNLVRALRKQYDAYSVILVAPFMVYRRQDHKEKEEEISMLEAAMDFLKHAGVYEMIVVTPHSPNMIKFGNSAGIKMYEVDPSKKFAVTLGPYLSTIAEKDKIIAYSPDEGAISRTAALAREINCPVIFSLKNRGLNNEVEFKKEDQKYIDAVIAKFSSQSPSGIYYADQGHIEGHNIIMVDDEVTTGGTASKFGWRLKKMKAEKIIFLASHPVLCRGWRRKLIDESPFDKILMGDTIRRPYEKRTGGKIHDVGFANLIAEMLYKVLASSGL